MGSLIIAVAIAEVLIASTLIPPGAASAATCWSEPPDLSTLLIRSDNIDVYDVHMEVANDFTIETGPVEIVRARWWGGYVEQLDYSVESFNLRFYEEDPDDPCLPGALLSESVIAGNAGETFVGYDGSGNPIYQYEAAISFQTTPGARYWFVCQAGDHPVPPNLWGRIGTSQVTACGSAFRSAYFGYPNWTGVAEMTGVPWDASQEFVCQSPTATTPLTWGRLRRMFR